MTTRVLYVARHHNERSECIVAALAQQPGLEVRLVCPTTWRDELGQTADSGLRATPYVRVAVPMLGPVNDYHRAVYCTVDFTARTYRPHIIHAEEEPESLAALQVAAARQVFAPDARLVLNAWQNVNRPKSRAVWLVARLAFAAADAMTCGSNEAAEVQQAMGYAKPLAVIPQKAADIRVFRPSAGPRPPGQHFTLLYAGRLLPEKGLETLVAAAGLLRSLPLRVRIVGDGPHRAAVQSAVAGYGVQDLVTLEPPVDAPALVEIFDQSDALVLPSRTQNFWKEQFGRILVEAMACRLPVIGSDSGAIPEVLGDAGLIFPEGNPAALATCVLELMRDEAHRRALTERAYKRVMEHYSHTQLAAQTAAFYRALLAQRQQEPAFSVHKDTRSPGSL